MKRLAVCLFVFLFSMAGISGTALAQPHPQTGDHVLQYGDSVNGMLTADTAAQGDQYTFEGSAGDTVIIAMNSPEFDTTLDLLGDSETPIATNDDAQGNTNSLIALTLPATRTYTIVARNFGSGTGSYTLSLRLGTIQPIEIGQTVESTLSDPAGDRYSFAGQVGDTLTITLTSSDFDTYLELTDSTGVQLQYNDDAGSVMTSQIVFSPPQDDHYIIIVRPYSTGSGAYTLTLEAGGTAEPPQQSSAIEYGQTISRNLTNASGENITFSGSAGDLVVITMISDTFDTYLTLLAPDQTALVENDDGGDGTNAQIGLKLPQTGLYTIVAGSFQDSYTGDYTLSLDTAELPTSYELAYGDSQTTLLVDPSAGDQWTFSGNEGDTVDIIIQAESFDSVVDLIGPTGSLLETNDTAPSFLGSEIVTTLPATGTYEIDVYDYAAYQSGIYTISVNTITIQPIESGQTINGTLSSLSGDRYAITVTANDALVIEMTSASFDTFLDVYDADQQEIAYNDDAGSTAISRLFFYPPSDGTYTIVARGLSASEGPYELSVKPLEADMIEYHEPIEASLTDPNGDFYTFQGTANDYVIIDMASTSFDTLLELYGPDGTLIMSNDDADMGSNSTIETSLPTTGLYTIVARSYSLSETGSYTLAVAPGTPPPLPEVNPAQSISYGQTINGNLVSPNTDSYEFWGEAGDTITITMTASFDTYIELYDSNMTQIIYNDDSGDGSLNSKIEDFTLPASGLYTIYAHGLSPDLSGPYTLTLASTSAGGLPTNAPQIGVLSDVACGLDSTYFVFTFDGSQGPNYSLFQASLTVDEPGGIVKIIPVGQPFTQSFTDEATLTLDGDTLYVANSTSLDDIAAQINEGLSAGPAHSAILQINSTSRQPSLSFLIWVRGTTDQLHGTVYWIEQPGQPIQSAEYSFVCP